jgi:3-methyladenine DNA glycosylase/8-oxoguanine DNA glycosylase
VSAPRAGRELESAALALLRGERPGARLARAAGCSDVATLGAALEAALHATPRELAALGREGRYRLAYGGPFHVEQTLRYLARDPHNLAERVTGAEYQRFFPVGARHVPVTLELRREGCTVSVQGRLSPAQKLALHERLVRFLGLEQPVGAFYRAVRGDAVMAPLVRRLRGVRIPQVPSLWEALCWAVIGQQINLAFAYRLRNRFIALGNDLPGAATWLDGAPGAPGALIAPGAARGDSPGGAVGGDGPVSKPGGDGAAGPHPFPGPQQTLAIPQAAWREAQFSRQKAAYLQGLARAFLDGTLAEAALEAADSEQAQATLGAVKGLGPWSVAYGLLRALGRVDALPVGDAGLRAALRHHYALPAPPDARQQVALMEPFRPYRGLATYYLWKSLERLRQE